MVKTIKIIYYIVNPVRLQQVISLVLGIFFIILPLVLSNAMALVMRQLKWN